MSAEDFSGKSGKAPGKPPPPRRMREKLYSTVARLVNRRKYVHQAKKNPVSTQNSKNGKPSAFSFFTNFPRRGCRVSHIRYVLRSFSGTRYRFQNCDISVRNLTTLRRKTNFPKITTEIANNNKKPG